MNQSKELNMPRIKKGLITTVTSKHLWREVRVRSVEGRIIMFPAWLWHCVEPNKSNDIRISVHLILYKKDLMFKYQVIKNAIVSF